jgi:anti-sigma regulatory factor (Ser/Thr protein kinase)
MIKNSNGSPSAPYSLQLRIPPLPRYARSARAALTAFGHYHRVSARDLENLTFALGEALANAIEHACTQQDIAIAFNIDENAIVATVRDEGQGLPYLPPAVAPFPASSTETGRGFAIMQRCTDFFDVRSTPGRGTLVTLGRYRHGRQEAQPAR